MTEPTSRKRSRDRAASGDQEAARSKQLIEDLNRVCSTITQFTFPERMASASTLLREAGLVIGVNANTRALRPPNAPLRLLIVCRDATPRLLCDALLALAAAQRVPVVCFAAADASGSVELGAALGVRTALAVGFKTHDDTHPPSTHDDTHRPSTHDDSRALVRDLAARLAESLYSG